MRRATRISTRAPGEHPLVLSPLLMPMLQFPLLPSSSPCSLPSFEQRSFMLPCLPCSSSPCHRGHQIGALVSMQSIPLQRGRRELEERAARLEAQYADESKPVRQE